MSLLFEILGRVVPVFLVMAVGLGASMLRWFDSSFVRTANTLVYRIAIPILVFTSVAKADFRGPKPFGATAAYAAAIFLACILGYLCAALLRLPRNERGAFLQGSVRGNFVIVGLAVVSQVLGPDALAQASLYFAFFLPFHNVISILVLEFDRPGGNTPGAKFASDGSSTAAGARETWQGVSLIFRSLLRAAINPIVVAVLLGVLFSVFSIRLPSFLGLTLSSLQQLAFPLALICIGGSLRSYYSEKKLPTAAVATLLKLVVMPAAAFGVGLLLGLHTVALVVLVVFAGSPAAVASYAVADSMGSSRDVAGSIIFFSHAACVVTLTAAITVVRLVGS